MPPTRLRVVLAPVGTRGDVAPLVALARGLRERGHEGIFVAPEDGVELIETHRFRVEATIRPFSSFLHETQNEIKVLASVFGAVSEQFEAVRQAATDCEAIVGSMLQLAAPSVAEATGASYFYAMFSPTYLQTTTIPVPVPIGSRKITISSPRLIRAMWWLQDLLTPIAARELMRERAALGLEPIRSAYEYLALSGELIYAFDPEITPVPADIDFGHPTAYWTLDDPSSLTPEIEKFLDQGEPPLYIGFGSMIEGQTTRLGAILESIVTDLDLRVIVSAPRAVERSDRILTISGAPHQKLFPRTRLVIHHGGAGTVATAARAGVPQLIIPHLGDQFYHGERVRALGIGPPPLPLERLTARAVKERIVQALAPAIRDAAERLGQHLHGRSGVPRAVEIIESSRPKT